MESTYDILEVLESDSSRLFKEDLLRKNRSSDLLKRVFVAAGDPYVNYFVSKFKVREPSGVSIDDDSQLESFLNVLLPDLSSRKVVGNEARAVVEAAFQMMSKRQQKWCQRILLRNLRVGVQETTINKVWPGAISKFSVQLAEVLESSFDSEKGIQVSGVRYPVRVEPKLDGLRCVATKRAGNVTLFTRSGSPIETLPTIKVALESAPWDNYVLDAEVMGSDWNESASVVMSHKTAKDDSGMRLHIFDAMKFEDWQSQDNQIPLSERVGLVSVLVGQLPPSSPIIAVEGKTVSDQDELLKFYSKCNDDGYEGIMVKDLDSPYVFKRSKAVLKLKPVMTWEGVVVGHYEGKRGSKREGLWGGFEVLLPNGVVTRVGGGFTDAMKAEIGLDPDSWVGRVVELEGQPEPGTKDGLTADGKVRFPVYLRERSKVDVDPKVLEAYERYASS